MQEILGIVKLKDAQLRYVRWGEGPKTLLCFHGFGLDKDSFFRLASMLSNEYTIFSFDIFFHGLSTFKSKGGVVTKSFWKDIMTIFLKENNIKRFSVLGFSMGGKFALATVEAFPAMIANLILIAPDGIKVSRWYKFATSTFFTRALLKENIKKPFIYFKLVKIARKLGLAQKSVARFANTQMQTRNQRELVFNSWTAFRKLTFDIDEITETLVRQRIKVFIFLGNHDKILQEADLADFVGKIPGAKLKVLNSGHSNLVDNVELFLAANQRYFSEFDHL
ncbi:MAG TPA: alpha/beta hydrolase [Cytophagaceae bacterium]|jgi:pimeloyl-ACP methyl ester carboxylesterase